MEKRETKNAAPGVASTENGNGIISTLTELNTDPNYKGKKEKTQADYITQFLKHGAENATSTERLIELTECGTVRALRLLVAAERANGSLIISNPSGGYYLPDSGEKGRRELEQYIRTMTAKASNTFKAITGARRALAVLDGQEEIQEGGQ